MYPILYLISLEEIVLSLASNVTGITVPLSGHWIPEEQPKFVIDQLFKFFGNNTSGSK